MHEFKEREIAKCKTSIMTRHIRRQSLTLQFLEKQAGLLVDILMKSINEVNGEDHLSAPRELQDEGVPVDNIELEAGDDQPHDAMRDSQDDETSAVDFHIGQSLSPPPEPLSQSLDSIGGLFNHII